MTAIEVGILSLYYAVLGVLTVYSLHRAYLVRLRRRSPEPPHVTAAVYPSVTIQLPLFNEPSVAARLLDAAGRIVYPGQLHLQILDDSTDVTSEIVAERVATLRAAGIDVEHVRRGSRDGYKAGALAHGMHLTSSDLFAVFDADFVPPSDVLRRMVPFFADPVVGMVQARWTHLNRNESLLTRVQALFLDAHFSVESAGRHFGGRFFNFNGTAGIWRRQAIDGAGGWSSSTLTEDLDLSYRAQLAGWKFVFLNDVEVPAELPAGWTGFQQQQHRWTRGSIQTARKLARPILSSATARAIRLEAFFHLTNNFAYLLSVVLALLLVPATSVRYANALRWPFLIDAVLFGLSTASILAFYLEGQRLAGRPRPPLRDLLAVIPIGIGMSVRNALAVVEGAFTTGGHFRRTPKRGDSSAAVVSVEAGRIPWFELGLVLFFALAFAGFVSAGKWAALPFLLVFLTGYAHVAAGTLSERRAWRISEAKSTV